MMCQLITTHNKTGESWLSPVYERTALEHWVAHALETSGGTFLSYEIIEAMV